MDALCYAMRLFMWVFPVYPLKKKLPEGSFPKIAFQPRIQIKAKILPEWDSVIRASEIISILVGPYARWEKLVGREPKRVPLGKFAEFFSMERNSDVMESRWLDILLGWMFPLITRAADKLLHKCCCVWSVSMVLNESEEHYLGSSFHPIFMCMR